MQGFLTAGYPRSAADHVDASEGRRLIGDDPLTAVITRRARERRAAHDARDGCARREPATGARFRVPWARRLTDGGEHDAPYVQRNTQAGLQPAQA